MAIETAIAELRECTAGDAETTQMLNALAAHIKAKQDSFTIINDTTLPLISGHGKPKIFSNIGEPNTFMQGFKVALERLAYFMSIAHTAKLKTKEIDFLTAQIEMELSRAGKSGFISFVEKDQLDVAVEIVQKFNEDDKNRRLEGLALQEKRVRKQIDEQREVIAAFDVNALSVDRKPIQEKIDRLEAQRKTFLGSNILPEGFEVFPIFAGNPEDQFHYNRSILNRELNEANVEYSSALGYAQFLEHRLDEIRRVIDETCNDEDNSVDPLADFKGWQEACKVLYE